MASLMLKAASTRAFINRVSNNAGGTSSSRIRSSISSRLMSTQSPDGVNPPTALAKLHLEDGTTLTGKSFGCHESMTGEVRRRRRLCFVLHVINHTYDV